MLNLNKTLTTKHSLLGETTFYLKTRWFVLRRTCDNLFANPQKFHGDDTFQGQSIIATSESELWNSDDNEHNWTLTAGKVQNLRLATRKLNGIIVPPNQVFSFWKHIGNPNFGNRFVVGREVREGCIVATKAGGLCQLSNALYDAALKAGFEIIERHRHTKVIKGSLAESDRDATIKWNYVDLRFRSPRPFKIEIDITTDKLLVRFLGTPVTGEIPGAASGALLKPSTLNDCYSCGNVACFKHRYIPVGERIKSVTTFILDAKWLEYDEYIKSISTENDFFIVPVRQSNFVKINNYNWAVKNQLNVRSTPTEAIMRAIIMRVNRKSENIFSLVLRTDKKIAKALARKIPIESTHLVVSQNLLPFLWEDGVFGGRTFDVLMTRLPMQHLHERLDFAYSRYPESKTLNDFRASRALIDVENRALTNSRHIITPHQEVANIFNNKSVKLNWVLPNNAEPGALKGREILFPAAGLGRKGAYEIKQLATELKLRLKIAGNRTEFSEFWNGLDIEIADGNVFNNVGLVIYPTYVEHRPGLLLKAIAGGIPVITTTASGILPGENITIVPVGNYEALREAAILALEKLGNK